MWFAKATFLFVRKEAVKNGKEAIFYRRSGVPRDPTRSIAPQPASRAPPWRRRMIGKKICKTFAFVR